MTAAANAGYHHFGAGHLKPARQHYFGHGNVFEAGGFSAGVADKMNVVVVVVAMATFIFAQGVFNSIIAGRNGMYDSFFNETLQRAVNGYPVKFFPGLSPNIGVFNSAVAFEKEFEDFFSGIRYAQLVAA
jgi:hypothetical protein